MESASSQFPRHMDNGVRIYYNLIAVREKRYRKSLVASTSTYVEEAKYHFLLPQTHIKIAYSCQKKGAKSRFFGGGSTQESPGRAGQANRFQSVGGKWLKIVQLKSRLQKKRILQKKITSWLVS